MSINLHVYHARTFYNDRHNEADIKELDLASRMWLFDNRLQIQLHNIEEDLCAPATVISCFLQDVSQHIPRQIFHHKACELAKKRTIWHDLKAP